MGFYTKFGDKLGKYSVEQDKLKGDFQAKFSGGYDLYQWCFHNNINKMKSVYDDTIFIFSQEDIKRAIKEKAMGDNNSKYVLGKLLKEMINNKLDIIYFEGDY